MSRILDYILEPNVVYTNGAFLIKVKVEDSYKYKKLLVTDNMKYSTLKGSIFYLTNATRSNNASCLDIEGNTWQIGTPTPTSPVEVDNVSKDNEIVVTNRNLLPTSSNSWESGQYNASGDKASYSTRIRQKKLLAVSPNTTYYFYNTNFVLRSYNRDKTFVRSIGNVSPNTTYTTRSDEYFLGVTIDGTMESYVEDTARVAIFYNNETNKSWVAHEGDTYRIDFGGLNLLSFEGIYNVANGTKEEDKLVSTNRTTSGTNNLTSYINPTINAKAGKKYYFSADIRLTEGSTGTLSQINDNISAATTIIRPTLSTEFQRYQFVKTYSVDTTINRMNIQVTSLVGSYEVKNIMITDNLDITYSPYVSNPIELCKIGDYADTLKKARGINLINNYNVSVANTNNWTITSTTNTLTIKHNNTYTSGSPRIQLGILKAGTYVLSGTLPTQLGLYLDNAYVKMLSSGTTFEVTGTENVEIVPPTNQYASGDTKTYINLMLEEGTTATSYEPYIVKNLFNKNDTPVETEKYINGAGTISSNINFSIFKVFLKPNTTYTITNSGGASNPRYGKL